MYLFSCRYTDRLGLGYTLFLTVNSGSALTTSVLLLCYIISPATYSRVRPSLFEVLLTGICCVLYITAATFLATAVYQTLYFTYHTVAGFSAYPALTAVYVRHFKTHKLTKCLSRYFSRDFLLLWLCRCWATARGSSMAWTASWRSSRSAQSSDG